MSKKIILIDGNSLIYRAFFALPPTMATSQGQPTNAVYGFTGMLIKLLQQEKPDILAVAFDSAGPTFRHEQFQEYKANREKMPDELAAQFPVIKDLLKTMEIPIFEISGYEADDILATLAKEAETKGFQVSVVTGDRDAYQLISKNVSIMTTKKGISDIVTFDADKVEEKYGIKPEQITDYLGLKGDSSDNIPGIPGIGEKTAAKLLQEFDSLENIITNLDGIKPPRVQELIKKHLDEARLSKELAVLDTDVIIDVDLELYRCGNWDPAKVQAKFKELEFNTLLDRLFPEKTTESSEINLDIELELIDSLGKINKLLDELKNEKQIFLYIKYIKDKENWENVGALVFLKNEVLPAVINMEQNNLNRDLIFTHLKPLLENKNIKKTVFQGKEMTISMQKSGVFIRGIDFDIFLAAYLIQPGTRGSSLSELARKFINLEMPALDSINVQRESEYQAIAVKAIRDLRPVLETELAKTGLKELFEQIEMPLQKVLAQMEVEGVGLDIEFLNKMSVKINSEIDSLEKIIFKMAGEEFNINSPQQVGVILFEKLELPPQKKTKTGYSTDQSSLIKLINKHPIIEKLLNYRELTKLKTTYIDALPQLVNPKTGRLHTSYNQAGTVTGRLSSSNPNLQNIPIRTELGRQIRGAFVPGRKDDLLLIADYSQIELRVMAHLSGDENLIQAFKEGKDIHLSTAAEVFGISEYEVNSEMRRKAKAVNFGIIYGISAYGLSEQLSIEQDEAKNYIDKYFERFPKVKNYIDSTIEEVKKNGFVSTIFGRRRYIPEIQSRSYQQRSFGERMAINAPIQGSAADIMKIAMIKLDQAMEKDSLLSKMVLQVHDELIFEVTPMEFDIMKSLVKDKMENAYPLRVPVTVDISWGCSWLEAK